MFVSVRLHVCVCVLISFSQNNCESSCYLQVQKYEVAFRSAEAVINELAQRFVEYLACCFSIFVCTFSHGLMCN